MTRTSLAFAIVLLACNEGTGSTGTGAAAEGGAAAGGAAAGAAGVGGSGGIVDPEGCNTEGVCRLYSGEVCGVCADCTFDLPECGACGTDAACGTDDACTCEVCASDCGPASCINNGVCVYYDEGCACDDCAADPLCAWFSG